ncbi:hypothetical protein TWF730_000428 [Orbilia blumenaviensis]|uniref:Uncharacterized protein n=1 Tax=Orbilia blumenaviensis TaxID=1796055 RepID=A0AAV9VPA6_9PEZI
MPPKRIQAPKGEEPSGIVTKPTRTRKRGGITLPEQELPQRRSLRNRGTVAAPEADAINVPEQPAAPVTRTRRGRAAAAAPQQAEIVAEEVPVPTKTRSTRSRKTKAKAEATEEKEEEEKEEVVEEKPARKGKKETRKKKVPVPPSTRASRSRSNSVASVESQGAEGGAAEPTEQQEQEQEQGGKKTRKIAAVKGRRRGRGTTTDAAGEGTGDLTGAVVAEYSGPTRHTRSKATLSDGKENQEPAPKRSIRSSKRATEPVVEQPRAKRQKVEGVEEEDTGEEGVSEQGVPIARVEEEEGKEKEDISEQGVPVARGEGEKEEDVSEQGVPVARGEEGKEEEEEEEDTGAKGVSEQGVPIARVEEEKEKDTGEESVCEQGVPIARVEEEEEKEKEDFSEQGVPIAHGEEEEREGGEQEEHEEEKEEEEVGVEQAPVHYAQAGEQGVPVARGGEGDWELSLTVGELGELEEQDAHRAEEEEEEEVMQGGQGVQFGHEGLAGDSAYSLTGSELGFLPPTITDSVINNIVTNETGLSLTESELEGLYNEEKKRREEGGEEEDIEMMDVEEEEEEQGEERGEALEEGGAAEEAWSGPANPSALAPLSQAAINAGHTAQGGVGPEEEAEPGTGPFVPQTPTRPAWGQWGHLRHQPRLSSPLKSYCMTAQYSPPKDDTPVRGRRVSENGILSLSGDPSPLRSDELLGRDFDTPVGSPSQASPRMRQTPGPRRRGRSRSVHGSSPLKNAVDFTLDVGDEKEPKMASPLVRLASDYDPTQEISELRIDEVPMTPTGEPVGNILEEVVEEQLPHECTAVSSDDDNDDIIAAPSSEGIESADSPPEKLQRPSRLPVPKPVESLPSSPFSARQKRVSQTKNLSDRELSKVTARNTTRNGVYKNAKFERKIVRITRQRPPSPTRDTQTAAAEEARQLRQRVFEETGVALGPGDDSDYIPPQISPSARKVKWHNRLEYDLDEDERAGFYTDKGILAPERVRRDSGTVHEITIQKILYDGEKDIMDDSFEEEF